DWAHMQHLLLAVEVLSPSSCADRFTKRRLYQEVGIPLYWLVDADEQMVEVWTPASTFPQFERERLVWHPEGADEPLVISCAELFRLV
ncbi:MAG TPA: Uma2 family endonuclease, partial [Gemmatimonadales bacterium]|nr:Uma2 family endonuclease [Gemmatimonadales bacterium]